MDGQRNSEKRLSRSLSRRRFVQGLVAGGVMTALDLWRWPTPARGVGRGQDVLTGSDFALVIEQVPVNFTGHSTTATTINGSVPGPLLRWREGDTVTLSVTNRLAEPTSIHWHGIRTPAHMDGVPGLSFPGIAPGETFVYRFPVRQSGTYWYHSHSHFQEQTGHYGPLIIDPLGKDPVAYDREYVVLLSDWTDEDPHTIFGNLKQQSNYYNFHQRTVGTFFSDVREKGLGATLAERWMWNRMNMTPTDILDVSGATYTYLLNGRPPAANWTALFRPGERVRLRFINGSSMTIFDVRIPNLPMTVVQTDGNDVEPVTVDELRISVAETYDVVVQPQDASAFTIFAQSADRTGYARGTLAPREGMTAPIPPMDPRPLRTMVDMGMGHMSGMGTGTMPGMNAERHNPQAGSAAEHHMPGMEKGDMSGTQMGAEGSTPSGSHAHAEVVGSHSGGHKLPPSSSAKLRLGPAVDNVAEMPTERLATTGAVPAGRRVLTYADLRARYRGTDPRPPAREIELHLTGNMERFIWTFDGEKFSDAEPIRLTLGERVRIILVNDSMMEHPIHLHGLWSELENGQGEFRPYKHTINVKPGERLSYLVSADTPGHWAYHCHLLYHMEAGMFRTVIVS
ncbi:MAG TPA: copper resistance system multicopper oxidase [Candidatus Binatia bacterium]|nr:copper resistance system multicopper oxidase [Candidatus Binatia bacterium]